MYQPVAELEKIISKSENEDEVMVAQFGVWSTSGSTRVPAAKVDEQKARYFSHIVSRDLKQLTEEAKCLESGYNKILCHRDI